MLVLFGCENCLKLSIEKEDLLIYNVTKNDGILKKTITRRRMGSFFLYMGEKILLLLLKIYIFLYFRLVD